MIDTGAVFSYGSKKYLNDGKKSSIYYLDKTVDGNYIYGHVYSAIRSLYCMGHWSTIGSILVGAIEDDKSLKIKTKALGVDAIIGTKDLGSMGNIIFNFSYNQPELIVFFDQGILTAKEELERGKIISDK